MYTREELAVSIEKYIQNLNLPSQPQGLYEPVRYTLEEGGKRLRPMLLLRAFNLFSDEIEKALPCAAALEVFHNFTLLHDDIMDNAQVRRGKSAVHAKWGRNTAILSGDAMVICAYKELQKLSSSMIFPVLSEFNKMALEVCEGQQYDIDFESRDEVELEEYIYMIKLKTAVIFGAAAKLGAMLAGAPENEYNNLYEFGIRIGLAFQLQDDYLDTYGTTEILGKEIGSDIAESKKTFLAITALTEAGAATKRALQSTFADHALPLAHKIGRVKTIYSSLDVPAITRKTIAAHLDDAASLLDSLSIEAARVEPLRQLIDNIRTRNK